MKPLVKYRGGKSKEISHIEKHIPDFNGRYIIDRYHCPDDMTKHNETNRLSEFESKATKTNSTAVAKDVNRNKQGSIEKNATRATTMTENKSKKIGIPSNRQGGAYTQDEIGLWKEIMRRRGNKQHISVHTNTVTGYVKVIKRDSDGNKDKTLDEFKMKNFDEIKKGIKKVLKK